MKVSVVIISKDEPSLARTLDAIAVQVASSEHRDGTEVLVVDASEGRLDALREAHHLVRWIDFRRPPGVIVTIPHQRNAGVRAACGNVVVFTDAGCVPGSAWLDRLVAPIVEGAESVTVGAVSGANNVYTVATQDASVRYVTEAATINMAFSRQVFDAVDGFDERFAYGSDVDFTWRLVDAGYRIRRVSEAVVSHDWGSRRRRARRARQYGAARARLYRAHPGRLVGALRDDPVPVVYPLWLLGLPLALRHRSYLLLPALSIWRARHRDAPVEVTIAHLLEGVGVLEELARMSRRWWRRR